MFRSAVLVALLGMAMLAGATAQRMQTHPLTNLAPAHEDVRTAFRFVSDDYAERLPLGEPVTVLCAFYNGGAAPLNVSMIMGSLNAPFQFDVYLKNFTPRLVNTTVGPDQELTFQYSLVVDASLLDTENAFRLALTVFYDDNTSPFTSTFFNDTRKFFYPDSPINMQSMLMYIVFIAAASFGAMFVLRGSGPSTSFSSSSSSSADADDSWSSGRAHMPRGNTSRRRKGKSSN